MARLDCLAWRGERRDSASPRREGTTALLAFFTGESLLRGRDDGPFWQRRGRARTSFAGLEKGGGCFLYTRRSLVEAFDDERADAALACLSSRAHEMPGW
jgi:hypothetical protein